jgi:NADPH:quinone reductase-like Zn-dependent oxidoreductase
MKAFVSRTATGIDSLAIKDVPVPGAIAAGQIRIAMRAASINYRDTTIISGTWGPPGPQGLIPCSDGAGEIVEVAPDVSRFKVGERVALTFNPDWIGGPYRVTAGAMGRGSSRMPGTMCEEIVVHHSEAVLLPEHLSFEEGAAYPCAGVTAWHALCAATPLLPGMVVLLQGGGGVSMLALQLAKMFGARAIMTSSSPERCARLKAFGADEVVDYKAEPEWNKAVRSLTNGAGVDLTIDIGGAETVDRSLASTRNGGRLALVGILTGRANAVSSLAAAGVDITPVRVGSRDDFEALNRAVAFHKSRPVIAARYGF